MGSLFVAHTPYHILLALSLAKRNDRLIIINDFDKSDLLEGLIRKYYESLLGDIVFLPGRKDANEVLWRRVFISRKNKRAIKKIIQKNKIDGLYIFNDRACEGQYAAYLARRMGCQVSYVEDGIAAYVAKGCISPNFFKTLALKLLFGHNHENILYLGTSSYVDCVLCFFPDLVIQPLKAKMGRRLDPYLFNNLDDDFINEATFKVSPDIECILVLPHSEILDTEKTHIDEMIERIASLVKKAAESHNKIALKYHPRQTKGYLGDYPGIDVLPNHIPMELVYLKLKGKRINQVMGPISTSLYTAKLILGSSISISVVSNHQTESEIIFFKTIGVHMMD